MSGFISCCIRSQSTLIPMRFHGDHLVVHLPGGGSGLGEGQPDLKIAFQQGTPVRVCRGAGV